MKETNNQPRSEIVQRLCAAATIAALALLTGVASGEDTSESLIEISEWRGDPDVYMIAIEGLVVEVNEDKTRDLGLRYGYNRTDVQKIVEGADVVLGRPLSPVLVPTFSGDELGRTTTGFTPRLPGLGVSLVGMDVNGGVVSARLRALLDQGEARITTRPIVLARNSTPTSIHVGSKVPYQDVEAGKNNLIVSEQEIGVRLDITPSIVDLKQQSVNLDVRKVEVSSISNFISQQNVDRPVFNKSDTRSKVTIRSGETYQLSSLKSRRSRTVREGIPVLMHIPFFGHFFSSREEVHEGVDVLFFVTPYIVPPGKNILLPYDFMHGQDLVEQGVMLRN